jgi:hypothetical protein
MGNPNPHLGMMYAPFQVLLSYPVLKTIIVVCDPPPGYAVAKRGSFQPAGS